MHFALNIKLRILIHNSIDNIHNSDTTNSDNNNEIIELIQTGVISFCNQVSPGLSMVILRSFSEGRRNF